MNPVKYLHELKKQVFQKSHFVRNAIKVLHAILSTKIHACFKISY